MKMLFDLWRCTRPLRPQRSKDLKGDPSSCAALQLREDSRERAEQLKTSIDHGRDSKGSDSSLVLVKRTWEILARNLDLVSVTLFKEIFTLAPEALEMFQFIDEPGDFYSSHVFVRHSQLVMATIDNVVKFLDDLTRIIPDLEDLGAKHANFGVLEKHYCIVGQALITTLDIWLRPEEQWSMEVKAAWEGVIDFVASTIEAGAAKHRASQSKMTESDTSVLSYSPSMKAESEMSVLSRCPSILAERDVSELSRCPSILAERDVSELSRCLSITADEMSERLSVQTSRYC